MTDDRIARRADEILAEARSHPRVQAEPEAERQAWARRRAERELASVRYLPGELSWSMIERAYQEIAARTPVYHAPPFRRAKPNQPTRPEVAYGLNVSSATLDRACIAFGKGKHWPPDGL